DRRRRQAPRLSRADAEEPRSHGRPRPLATRDARAHPGGAQPRGGLCAGPAQRDEGVGVRWAALAARPAQGRPAGFGTPVRRTARFAVRSRLPPEARRHDLRPRLRRGLTARTSKLFRYWRAVLGYG